MNEKIKRAVLTLSNARQAVEFDTVWRHKKGGIYRIMDHALNTDDGTAMVLYRRIGGPDFDPIAEEDNLYARPIAEWTLDRFVRMRDYDD